MQKKENIYAVDGLCRQSINFSVAIQLCLLIV